ncbi:DEAD/DEAH box helicase [Sphaerisporangium sp. NPDC051017]|uniref:DEAD/DEAH box helicase n=1 Tax=Sphaerisporangium sp. NPDC051017 TaxID=3154636 RepID=UPI00341514A7
MSLSVYGSLLGQLNRPVEPWRASLVRDAADVWSRPGFDTFLSLPRLGFEPFDYQVSAAKTVLRRMRGRAILADEVGLGKTIEAGLVLSELRARGLAARSLVVTPTGLVGQWCEELGRKFGLPTTVATGKGWDEDGAVVVASLATGRRDPLRSRLTAEPWDLVIIDEAHRVRGVRSASGKLARELRGRYYLLLTATPVENKLQDLYELVSIVSPGLLGTAAQFKSRHGSGPHSPRDPAELRARTREVMVRHRRSEVSVLLPQRLAETVLVAPAEEEAAFYSALLRRIRAEAGDAPHSHRFTLRALAKLAGSSPAAAAPTLAKIGWDELASAARAVQRHEKTAELVHRLKPFVEREEKVLVFTAYRQTLDSLAQALEKEGIPAAVYHGSLSRHDKDKAVASFQDEVPVLLSTESAGEGRNLQFCHVMVNMDLPWNPMQIEQRLGRLHRVGQTHDVLLTNLVARGTIEQRILHVLEKKINLFELVVGELDMILGRVDDDFDFEESVFDAFVSAGDDDDFGDRLESLGDDLARARTDYLAGRGAIDALVGDD